MIFQSFWKLPVISRFSRTVGILNNSVFLNRQKTSKHKDIAPIVINKAVFTRSAISGSI